MTNLADNLTKTAQEHPDRPAVKLDDMVLSYAELHEGARRVASLLTAKGVGPGDRVGLVLPNVPAFPVLFYGAVQAGAVVVPMNPLLKGREVKYYLEDSGASIVFAWKDMAEEAGKGAEAVGIGLELYVYVRAKYIEIGRPSKKLDIKIIGPFAIINKFGSQSYYVMDMFDAYV